MRLIWVTRGRTWGFQFLRRGGFDDPLGVYEDAFSGLEDRREVFRRNAETAALRFPDPLGRQDAAGRAIPHDFVILDPVDGIDSVHDAMQLVWSLVADEFASVWDLPEPPSATG